MEIKIFSKERCVQCRATERQFKKQLGETAYSHFINHINIDQDDNARDSLIEKGYRQTPIVMIVDGKPDDAEPADEAEQDQATGTETKAWSGYRPDLIKNVSRIALDSLDDDNYETITANDDATASIATIDIQRDSRA